MNPDFELAFDNMKLSVYSKLLTKATRQIPIKMKQNEKGNFFQ
jgi:hypothetical protein